MPPYPKTCHNQLEMKYAPALLGVGQLSGSGGSVTASHNRYGSYLRNRTIPVNPNTVSQQAVRALFGGVSQAWRTLTEAQRTAWSDLSPNVPRVDALGQSYVLSGNALCMSVNSLLQAVGQAVNYFAPALDSPPVMTSLSVVVDVTGLEGMIPTFTNTGGTANNFLIVRASAPRSPGRDYIGRSELRQITVLAGNAASPGALEAAYEAVFGAGWEAEVGMEIVFEFFPVSENGLPGVGLKASSIIQA